MSQPILTRDLVIERSKELPAFPRVISEILAALDDVDACLKILTGHIERDPVITARVLGLANRAAANTRRQSSVKDVYTATSLIGLGRVREIAEFSAIQGFVDAIAPGGRGSTFWGHSVAVGVCAVELAMHIKVPISPDTALVAGLLHDIGQLWLYRFDPESYRSVWDAALAHSIGIEEAERERFGTDHSTIGAWLGEHWSLTAPIVAAIRSHHAPDSASNENLVPLIHVAEVLSNALDLTGRSENRVTALSGAACRQLGVQFNDEIRPLFGRMEARSRYANSFFQ